MGLDSYYYTEDYYRQVALMTGTGQVAPTSWKIVKNGGNPLWTPYNYIINDKDNSVNGFSYVKLPAGSSVVNEIIATGSMETNANAQLTIVDDDGTWSSYNATVMWKQNLVDQETGNSCLEIVLAKGSGYATERNSTYLAAFPAQNAGLKLTGLEIRKKNLGLSTTTSITLKSPIAGTYAGEVEMGSFTTGAIGSWNTATVTISNNVSRWIDNQVGPDVLIPIYFRTLSSSATTRILIDRITPIYS
jgi:hypothetical protein